MMSENIELQDFKDERPDDNDDIDETNIDYEDDLLDSLDWLQTGSARDNVTIDHNDTISRYFGNNVKAYAARNIRFFIKDVIADNVPEEYQNPRFIKYLMDRHSMEIKKTLSVSGLVSNYEIGYYGKPYENENGVIERPWREYKTVDGELNGIDEYQCVDDLDYLYDRWRTIERNIKLKKAGIVGGIIIGVTSLITGLALGLKRAGHSMTIVMLLLAKWKKLTPAQRKKMVIPWTDIEKGYNIIG